MTDKPPAGVAKVTITDNGKVIMRDAYVIPLDRVLTNLRMPIRYGGWFDDHEVEFKVEFDPPVRPERHDG